VPTALPDPEPFTPETLSPIKVGVTTRDQVRELFSHWQYRNDDGPQVADIEPLGSPDAPSWVFALNRQVGDWSYVGLAAYWPVPMPLWGGTEHNYEYNWVLVDFNADDTVAAVWVATEKAPCKPGRACYRDGRLVVIESEDATAAARSRSPAEGTCSLFIYSDRTLSTPVTIDDDSRSAQYLWPDTFLRLDVRPGLGAVLASVDRNAAQIAAQNPSMISLPATCTSGEVRYIALSAVHAQFTTTEVPAASGADAIMTRLLVDHVPDVQLAVIDHTTKAQAPAARSDPERSEPDAPLPEPDPASEEEYRQSLELLAVRDPAAWPLLCHAADSGSVRAQMELGYLHRTDLHRPADFTGPLGQDNRLAYVWFRVAELGGYEGTGGASQYIASQLSDIELAEAEELVRAWHPGLCPMGPIAKVKP
jgi:hypothetical protein